MKERPILFSGPMVRAILDGTKTQTRRVVKPTPEANQQLGLSIGSSGFRFAVDKNPTIYPEIRRIRWDCPYGQPGNRLWVREAHAFSVIDPESLDDWKEDPDNWEVIYRADEAQPDEGWRDGNGKAISAPWRPSIHMPRTACRITLEITGVRVERLRDITEADSVAEGAPWAACGSPQEGTHKVGFAQLWESINGSGSWDANPWVWAVEFRRLGGGAA